MPPQKNAVRNKLDSLLLNKSFSFKLR